MHPLLQRADTFRALLKHTDHGLPYRFETIFKDETGRNRWASKRKLKLLRRIDEALRPMLEEGEEVRFLTHGTRYAVLESWLMVWFIHYFNRRAIVLTDRRILLIQIHWRDRPGRLRSQVRLSGITRIEQTIAGYTELELRNDKKLMFTRVPRDDAEFLRSLIERLQETGVSEGGPVTGHEPLCPHCYADAEIGEIECETCKGTFKSPRKAGLLSLLFPGIGNFYMGHRKLAVFEFIVVALLWSGTFLLKTRDSMTVMEALSTAAMLVAFLHVPDAAITRFMARRGIFPEKEGQRVVGRGPEREVREAGVAVG